MDERELLVLGLLKSQSQHGYQINEFIERNLGRVTDMKKATAYSILKRLDQAGMVNAIVEQEGNRPPRQVYSITDLGEQRFNELLKLSIVTVDDVTPTGDIAIMFLDHLPKEEIIMSLQERLTKVNAILETYQNTPQHGHGFGVDLSIRHRTALLQADSDWLSTAISYVEDHDGQHIPSEYE